MRVSVPEAETLAVQILDPRPGQEIVAVAATYPVGVQLANPSAYVRVGVFCGPRFGEVKSFPEPFRLRTVRLRRLFGHCRRPGIRFVSGGD